MEALEAGEAEKGREGDAEGCCCVVCCVVLKGRAGGKKVSMIGNLTYIVYSLNNQMITLTLIIVIHYIT